MEGELRGENQAWLEAGDLLLSLPCPLSAYRMDRSFNPHNDPTQWGRCFIVPL